MMEKFAKFDIWEDRAKILIHRNRESQPKNKFKAKSWYIFNSSSASASAVGHILQLSSMLSFRSNFLSEGLLRVCTICFWNFFYVWFLFTIWFSNLFTIWLSNFLSAGLLRICTVWSCWASSVIFQFCKHSQAKGQHELCPLISQWVSRACLYFIGNPFQRSQHFKVIIEWRCQKSSASENEPFFKKIFLLLMLMPDTQKA